MDRAKYPSRDGAMINIIEMLSNEIASEMPLWSKKRGPRTRTVYIVIPPNRCANSWRKKDWIP